MNDLSTKIKKLAEPYDTKLERLETMHGDVLFVELSSGIHHSKIAVDAYDFAMIGEEQDEYFDRLISNLKAELRQQINSYDGGKSNE